MIAPRFEFFIFLLTCVNTSAYNVSLCKPCEVLGDFGSNIKWQKDCFLFKHDSCRGLHTLILYSEEFLALCGHQYIGRHQLLIYWGPNGLNILMLGHVLKYSIWWNSISIMSSYFATCWGYHIQILYGFVPWLLTILPFI